MLSLQENTRHDLNKKLFYLEMYQNKATVMQVTFSLFANGNNYTMRQTSTQNLTLATVGICAFNNAHKQIGSMTLDSQKPSGFGPRDPEPEKALHQGSGGADGGGALEAVTHSLCGM